MCVIRYCYLVALPLALGCVPPVPPDVPTADAGPDQTVAVGTAVTLDGSGSTDPNGETLVYFWEQTGGPTVALSDVHGVRPAFTALNESTVLTFRLTVTNRDNQSASDSVDVKVTGTIGKIPQLFVANRSVDSVVSFQYPATQDGDVSPTTHLTGLLTQLKAPTACAVPSNARHQQFRYAVAYPLRKRRERHGQPCAGPHHRRQRDAVDDADGADAQHGPHVALRGGDRIRESNRDLRQHHVGGRGW